MRIISRTDLVVVQLEDWGTLRAEVNLPLLLQRLCQQSPDASLNVEFRVPLNDVPDLLDTTRYQVQFTLGSPYTQPHQLTVASYGDSLLGMRSVEPCRVVVGRKGEDDIPVILIPNEHQRLARVVVFVPRRYNAQSAEARAYAAVGPLLSELSVLYRVPLHAVLTERFLFEPPNMLVYGRTVLVPYEIKTMNLDDLVPLQALVGHHAYERAISHYREGMVSVSPLHRFLSYFKAIEAIQVLRQDLISENPSLRFQRTYVSDTPEIRFKMPELIGQPHTKVIDRYLRKPYRDSVAHWGDGDRTDLSHDHRYGLVMYNLLCHLANDVFHGMFWATVEAMQGATPNCGRTNR